MIKYIFLEGLPGVGKTTICANLGCALAKSHQRVLLLDADIGLNNLDVVMGLEDQINYNLLDLELDKTVILIPFSRINASQSSSPSVKT